MRNTVKIATVALAVLTILFLSACGGGSSPPTPQPISVAISGSSDVLYIGASRTFTATVTNSSNLAVTWSVVSPGMAVTYQYVSETFACPT
jgi:hypothetical protein